MGIATELEQAIDYMLDGFVTEKSAALSSALIPVAFVSLSLYIIVIGYSAARGELRDPLMTPVNKLIRFAIVMSLALVAGKYQGFVISALSGLQEGLIGVLSGASSIGEAIDAFMVPYDELSRLIGLEAGENLVPDLMLLVTLVLVVVAQVVIVAIGLGYYLIAKVALTLLLAIGPIFIFGAAFPSTQRYAESWLGQTLNYVLLNVLIAAAFSLLTSIAVQFADQVLQSFQNGGQIIRDAVALVILSVALCIVMLNLNAIAMGLAGGASLGGGALLPAMAARGAMGFLARMMGGRSNNSKGKKKGAQTASDQEGGETAPSSEGSKSSSAASDAKDGTDKESPAPRTHLYQGQIVEPARRYWI